MASTFVLESKYVLHGLHGWILRENMEKISLYFVGYSSVSWGVGEYSKAAPALNPENPYTLRFTVWV